MKKFEYQNKDKSFRTSITIYNFSESMAILKNKIKKFKLSWPIKIKIEKQVGHTRKVQYSLREEIILYFFIKKRKNNMLKLIQCTDYSYSMRTLY